MLSDLEIYSKIPIKGRGSFLFPAAHLGKHIHWTRRTFPPLSCSGIHTLAGPNNLIPEAHVLQAHPGEEQFLPEAAGEGTGPVAAESRWRNWDPRVLLAPEVSPWVTCRELALAQPLPLGSPGHEGLASAVSWHLSLPGTRDATNSSCCARWRIDCSVHWAWREGA